MKDWSPASALRWLFASQPGAADRLLPRCIFLRALGLIYYSAFFSLVFQIKGLIGPHGVLPANEYLQAVAEQCGRAAGFFRVPIRWDAARSRIYCHVLRSTGMAAGMG